MFLLDTNHCSRLIDGDEAVTQHLADQTGVLIATSVIVQGELLYMAARSDRREFNRTRVEQFLLGVRIYPLAGDVAAVYGDLKGAIMQHFGPKEKAKRRKVTAGQLGFQDNDLWIAATALRHGLTVVSADSDFARIQQALPLAVETWLQTPSPKSSGRPTAC